MLLEDILKVRVHWSESVLLNDEIGIDDVLGGNGDIETDITAEQADDIISRAAKLVDGGCDKTVLTIYLKTGKVFCEGIKFYITRKTTGLLNLIGEEVITVSQDGG